MLNNPKKIFCVDIGGTKTAFAIFDETGKEYFYDCFPTNPEKGPENLIERIAQSAKGKLDGITNGVIASPGPLDTKTGDIVFIATMGWKNVPIVKMFTEKFNMPFKLIGDCDAGGLGVWKYCGFSKYCNLAYMSISTGIGGGIIANSRPYMGKGNAAFFGHIPVPGEGLKCGCGSTDCLELYASGSGMEKRYLDKTGNNLSCKDISSLARKGDPVAKDIFEDAGDKLVFALSSIVANIDPEIVVLGGSVCKDKDLFLSKIEKALPNLKIGFAPDTGKQVLYGALAYGFMD